MATSGVDNIRDRFLKPELDEWFGRVRENLSVLPMGELQASIRGKMERLQELLGRERLAEADEADLAEVVGLMATVRPKASELWSHNSAADLRQALQELLFGKGAADGRLKAFTDRVQGIDFGVARDLGAEALHFTDPARYPLWTRWVWDPRVGTGALPYALEFTIDKEAGVGPYYHFGVLYKDVADSLGQLAEVLELRDWGVTGDFQLEIFLSYMYADYLHKMFFSTLSKSISGVFPTVLGVMHWILGLDIPPEARAKGLTETAAS